VHPFHLKLNDHKQSRVEVLGMEIGFSAMDVSMCAKAIPEETNAARNRGLPTSLRCSAPLRAIAASWAALTSASFASAAACMR
jgi:hypothetical protein